MIGFIVEASAALTFGLALAYAIFGWDQGCGCDECVR